MEESQRALTYIANQLNEEHGSLQAVASDAAESYMKYIQEVVKHPWETTKQSANLGKNYFKLIKICFSVIKSTHPCFRVFIIIHHRRPIIGETFGPRLCMKFARSSHESLIPSFIRTPHRKTTGLVTLLFLRQWFKNVLTSFETTHVVKMRPQVCGLGHLKLQICGIIKQPTLTFLI